MHVDDSYFDDKEQKFTNQENQALPTEVLSK